MPWGLANTAHTNGNAVTTITVPATTIGNLGILAISYDNGSTFVAPTGGGTWTLIGTTQLDSTAGQDAAWYRVVFTSSVTSISVTASFAAVSYCEFSPPAGTISLDVQDTTKALFTSTTTTDGNTSNAVTPAAANELLLGAIYTSQSTTTFTKGTNFNTGVAEPGSGTTGACAIEWKLTAGGSENTTWTTNSTTRSTFCQIASFKPADVPVGGSAPAVFPMMLALRRFQKPGAIVFGFPKYGGAPAAALFNQPLTADAVLVTASMQRQTNKNVTASSVGVTASMLRTVNKLMTATAVVVTANMLKQVGKLLTATAVVVTATLATVKVKLLAMTATAVVVTATMVKQVNKRMTASSVVVTASMLKQVNKILTAAAVGVTATLATIKVKLVTMTATAVVVTASMVRQVNKPLTATAVAVTASIMKQVNKKLTATAVAVTATLTTIKVKLVAMTATAVVVTASMVRQTQLHLSATVAVSGSMVKRVGKALSATVNATASMVATFSGQLIGPFAAKVVVADIVSTMTAALDAPGTAVSTQDATGVVVTTTDASGTTVSTQDATGTRVDVSDLLP